MHCNCTGNPPITSKYKLWYDLKGEQRYSLGCAGRCSTDYMSKWERFFGPSKLLPLGNLLFYQRLCMCNTPGKGLKSGLVHNNRPPQPHTEENLHTLPCPKQVSPSCPKPVPCSVAMCCVSSCGLLTRSLYPRDPCLWEAVTQPACPFNLRGFCRNPGELIESVTRWVWTPAMA